MSTWRVHGERVRTERAADVAAFGGRRLGCLRRRHECSHGLATHFDGATLRRQLIAVPARIAMPQHRRVLHLPAHWPWAAPSTTLWAGVFTLTTGPPPIL
jgi:hypothetical protein